MASSVSSSVPKLPHVDQAMLPKLPQGHHAALPKLPQVHQAMLPNLPQVHEAVLPKLSQVCPSYHDEAVQGLAGHTDSPKEWLVGPRTLPKGPGFCGRRQRGGLRRISGTLGRRSTRSCPNGSVCTHYRSAALRGPMAHTVTVRRAKHPTSCQGIQRHGSPPIRPG